MKRETKKKIVNITLASAITSSVLTPISIVLGKHVSDQIILNNKRILEKDTQTNEENLNEISQINEDFTFDINLGNGMNVHVVNPNLTKAVPNGYIVVVGDSYGKNKKIVCLDKKNPSKILWELAPDGTLNLNIYSIEYTPYNNGTLVLLYSKVDNDKIPTNSNIKYAIYNNVDNSPKLLKNGFFSYNENGRLDTWALSPVFNEGVVTKYFAYCKDGIKNESSFDSRKTSFFLISLEGNSSSSIKEFEIDLSFYGGMKIILSAIFIEYDNRFFSGLLMIDSNNKIRLNSLNTTTNNNVFSSTSTGLTVQKENVDIQMNNVSDDYFVSLAKSSINSSTILNTDIVFFLNYDTNDKQKIHSNSLFINANITKGFPSNSLVMNFSSSTSPYKSIGNDNVEIFNGYFINDSIIKDGLKNNNYPNFIGIGKNNEDSSLDKNFVFTINNVLSSNISSFSFSNDLDNPNWRIYRINENKKSDNKNVYSGWISSHLDNNEEYGLGVKQGEIGLPILDYFSKDENIFNKNIFLTKNGSNKGIVINQKDRGQSTTNEASYGYYTRIDKRRIIDEQEFTFKFSASELFNSNKIKDINNNIIKSIALIKIKNFIFNEYKSTNLELIEDSTQIDYNKGTLVFSFYLSNYFDKNGKLNSTTKQKIIVKIEDFVKALTELKNNNINIFSEKYINSLNKNSSIFIPSLNVVNESSKNNYWDIREIVWKALLSNEFFNNEDSLKQKPLEGATTDEKRQNFNKFFKSFEWTSYDNEKGFLKANFSISEEYSFKEGGSTFEDVTFLGLRKISNTKLFPITNTSPLKNDDWNDINIPYLNKENNNEIVNPDYVSSNVKIITKQEIKEWIVNDVFKNAYDNAKPENGFSATDNLKVENLPYKSTLENQNGIEPTTQEKIGPNDIELTNFKFFPKKGMLSFDISLNIWYKDGNYYQKAENLNSEIPKATWYVSGFRTDNVTTFIDDEKLWKINSIGGIIASQSLSTNENKNFVKRKILEYGYENKYITLPYWVKINSLDDFLCELVSEKVDDTFGTASFKIFIKNGMFIEAEDGSINEVKENDGDHNWKTIEVSGFSNKNAVLIDSSTFWEKSNFVYQERIIYDIESNFNDSFDNFLSKIEEKILHYIAEVDKNTRPSNVANTFEEWSQQISFKYFLDNSSESYDRQDLQKQIKNIFMNTRGKFNFFYNTRNLRGIKLWVKIVPRNSEIKLPLSDSSVDETKGKELKGLINTSGITMSFNMKEWFNNLEISRGTTVQSIDIDSSTISSITPPMLKDPSLIGNNISFIYMEALLKNAGYKFEYTWKDAENKVVTKDSLPTNFSFNLIEKTIDLKISYSLNELNSKKEIFPFYIFSGFNSNFKIHQQYSKTIKLSLALFSVLRVNLDYLKELSFAGNTKDLSNFEYLKTKEEALLKKIKDENKEKANNEETKNQIDNLELDVLYSINKETINPSGNDDKIWVTLEKMKEILSTSKINFSSNRVYAKYIIKSGLDVVDFRLSSEKEIEINKEEFLKDSKFKIYIHNTDATNSTWIQENLKLQGSQTEYRITKYEEWIQSLSKGLIVQFNTTKQGIFDEPDDSKWKEQFGQDPISNSKNFWIRFRVRDGFIFEGILSENETYSKPIKLDATKISVVLKLESEWLLTYIELSGNTKHLQINESKIKEHLEFNNLNVVNDIIKIQYTIEGLNQWFDKDNFKTKLEELNGSLNEENWIIKREDIKARFIIDPNINNSLEEKYYLSIDGIFIDEENDIPIRSLITDKYNVGVKGYINVDKLSSFFVAENFEVIGTNNQAILLTKNANEFNKRISRYSKLNIFQLLYTNSGNDFSNVRNSIINSSGLIEEYTYLNGNFSERYFALSFRGLEHYEVYENDKKLANGYVLSSPSISVNIRIEIENPFIGNEVSIKFVDENNKPIFYQGDGGFDVLIKDTVSSQNKNFEDFISSLSVGVGQNQWTQEQKDAMELVYFVSNRQLTDDELKKIIKYDKMYEEGDQNQKYGVWKILDPTNKRENLNLLVNDYVTIAIRVKKDKLNSEGVNFIMKEYENFIPHQKRVYGYKVQTSSIAIDFDSLTLKNVGQAESSSFGLDGYAQLKSISLKKDEKKHYLGVSLKLNYFTDFHKNSNNEVLVSGSGERLVKRNSNGAETKGYYKDKNGIDILDDKGNKIPILEKSGLLSEPIKNSSPTRSKQLLDLGNGVFTLELSNNDSNAEYSFFKKQEIEFEISNKKGDAPGEEYDYYMDESFNNKVTYILDKEIKTPIPNETNIKYEFNSKEFIEKIIDPANLLDVYKNSYDPNQLPITGQSQIVSMFSITRTENNGNELTLDTLEKIQNQISIDFDGKVILRATYYSLDGKVVVIDGGDISQIKELKNGDRFKIEIVSANEDNWIFANQPNPLVFTISGLFEKLIEKSILKNLRVKQSGEFNGEGNFQIYVNDPKEGNATSSLEDILGGYYFLIRVWDDKKTIKHNWTKEFSSITDLKNGDKVEWKLVSHNGSPLYEAYHNTIANPDNHKANENVYSFSIVNQSGPSNSNITEPIEGIGINPSKEDEYPENSGFTISGLKEKEDSSYTTIHFEEFTRLMNLMNFSYIGPNGSGDMISNKSILDVEVNTIGKSSTKFTLDYLINNNYLQFYYNNNTSTQLNSFNWNQVKDENGHWLTSPGTLSNGDIVKIRYKDPSMSGYYEYDAPVVSGLKDKVDNMSMFAWLGIGLVTFVTLGIFALVYLHSTKKKLK